MSVAGGTAVYINDPDGWGTAISVISHAKTQYLYGHTSKRLVKDGSLVIVGQIIAECGQSGSATGPHCHFEEWPQQGNAINPRPFLELLGLPPK